MKLLIWMQNATEHGVWWVDCFPKKVWLKPVFIGHYVFITINFDEILMLSVKKRSVAF